MSLPQYTRQARADLREITAYIARKNKEAAQRTHEAIVERVRIQAITPRTGQDCSAVMPGLRKVAVAHYVVFFRPVGETIEVLRILHSSRDTTKIIREQTDL